METLKTVAAMQAATRTYREAGRRIALVPTMGFLHEGHLSLIRLARKQADLLVVSIFVNPTQFGQGEDLDRYPRDLERDTALCGACGVDVIFCPSTAEMYASDATVVVDEQALSKGLCGATRKGHFRGVLTVVAKLFNVVQPDIAVFGQKDAQQAALIQRMVRDLNFPVEILLGPIVRDPDGLAMSSRNTYLSADEREQALWLYRLLAEAEQRIAGGITDSERLRREMEDRLTREASGVVLDYIAIVDAATLQPVNPVAPGTLIALAAHVGNTRLIDNVRID